MSTGLQPGARTLIVTGIVAVASAGRPAHAQRIVPAPGAASCELTPDCKDAKYTFVAGPGQTLVRWEAAGDLRLLSPPADNPAVACSAGYGKGRLTATYYELRHSGRCGEKCPDTLYRHGSYDVYKSFKSPTPIFGPVCAVAGQEVTYRVEPVLTDYDRRQAHIGTDSYVWSGFPAGAVRGFAGDSSTITLLLDADQAPFTLRCQVGRCNSPIALPVTPAPPVPVLTPNALCHPTTATGSVTVVLTAAAGVTYRAQLPAGWQVAPAALTTTGVSVAASGPLALTITPDGSGGDLLVLATNAGGCAPTTAGFRLTRRLVSGSGAGTQSLTNPGCFATSNATSINMTLTNAPANTLLRWTLPTSPSGWNITTAGASKVDAVNNVWLAPATVAIAVPAGHSGGTVRVNADGCPSAPNQEVKRLLAITGTGGCTYTIQRTANANDQGFSLSSSSGGPGTACLPSSNPAQQISVLYTWRAPKDPAYRTGPTDSVMVKTSTSAVVTFDYPVPAAAKVRCAITQTSGGCLTITAIFQLVVRPTRRTTGRLSIEEPSAAQRAALMRALECYPNPADGLVRIGLPAVAAEGATRLTLVNALGQVQRTLTVSKATTATLDVRELPADTYILRVELPNGQTTGRALQVQH